VVNPALVVYGTSNLRVVDVSIMPVLVSGYIQTAVYRIAERAAEMMIVDFRGGGYKVGGGVKADLFGVQGLDGCAGRHHKLGENIAWSWHQKWHEEPANMRHHACRHTRGIKTGQRQGDKFAG
jgi:hypothetical protein